MNTLRFVMALGAIATASAGLITPITPLISAYGALAPQTFLTSAIPNNLLTEETTLDGQYIPDNLEKLYDDGSYKPEVRDLPLTASPYGLVPAGSGLEGHYVPDNLEKLYDDGSYKPEITALPLTTSPYGLVPAGSGLEGQYVLDITEKLYDDGSYRPEAVVKLAYL